MAQKELILEIVRARAKWTKVWDHPRKMFLAQKELISEIVRARVKQMKFWGYQGKKRSWRKILIFCHVTLKNVLILGFWRQKLRPNYLFSLIFSKSIFAYFLIFKGYP